MVNYMDGAGVFFLFVLFFLLIWIFTLRGCVRERRNGVVFMRENMQYNYPSEGNGVAMM